LVAARTLLAAGGRCSPVDRHASCAWRWAGTAVSATAARWVIRPGRWRARSGPLSVTGSCRSSPDRHAEATSPDRGRRGVMPGDRVGSLLLYGFQPMLGTPSAGVGRIHPDGAQRFDRRRRYGDVVRPGGVQIPAALDRVVADVVAHRTPGSHPIGPLAAAVAETHRRTDPPQRHRLTHAPHAGSHHRQPHRTTHYRAVSITTAHYPTTS
jgi:hypothetical protein